MDSRINNRMFSVFGLILLLSFLVSAQERRSAYGILIDNTGSLRTQFDLVIESAKQSLDRIPPDATVSVFTFATDPNKKNRLAKFVAGIQCDVKREQALDQIDNLSIGIGMTPLFDAIRTSAALLNIECSNASKRVLILISDGADRASSTIQKSLISELKANGTQVLVIGIIDQLDQGSWNTQNNSPYQKSKKFLETIAKETDGRVIFVSSKKKGAEAVKKLFEDFLSK